MTRSADRSIPCAWLLATLCAAGAAQAQASDFARPGTKATLSVEYVFESRGTSKTSTEFKRWDRRRVTRLATEVIALPPGPLSTLHAPSAAQSADLERRAKVGEKLAVDTAPGVAVGMAAMEQAMKRCGDDEDCVAKAMMKSGVLTDPRARSAATAVQAAGRELQPMGPRYQIWAAKAQSGSYEVAETEHHEFPDQQCPNLRCTADTVTNGKGVPVAPKQSGMPAISAASVEMDMTGGMMVMALPLPFAPLPVMRVVTSNLAAGKPHSPAGRCADDRPIADGLNPESLRLSVPLKGAWRNASGEQVVPLGGKAGEGTKLTVRWRLSAT